ALADTNNQPLSTGSTINFAPVDVNTTATATITISNQGRGTGTVSGVFLAGTAFRLSGLPLLPATLPAGQSVHFGIVFAPTVAGTLGGSFRIDLSTGSVNATLTGSTAAPKLSLQYVDPDTNNLLSLQDGS